MFVYRRMRFLLDDDDFVSPFLPSVLILTANNNNNSNKRNART